MHFSQHYLEGLGCMSYLIADEDAGQAVVVDPQVTIREYLDEARELGVRITHVVDTHIHADHLSGNRALADATGATLHLPAGADAPFHHAPLGDGDAVEVGSVTLRAVATPGHTPEHVSLEVYDASRGAATPYAVLTGDTLFVGSVGRPDLAATETADALARQLHATVRERILPMDDGVLVYPGHGAGSACGTRMGRQLLTSVGYERATNPFLQEGDRDAFVDRVTANLPPKPGNAGRLKRMNARGPPREPPHPAAVRALPPEEFSAATGDGRDALVLDAREPDAFAANHVPGAVNVPLAAQFPGRAARFLEWGLPVYLVLEDDGDLATAVEGLARVGAFPGAPGLARLAARNDGGSDVRGVLKGGMYAWRNAGLPYEGLAAWPVAEAAGAAERGEARVLDVRTEAEWRAGHAPGARWVPWEEVPERADELDRDAPWAVVCSTGYRSSTAASALRRAGFPRVANVLGGMTAWEAAGLEVAREPAEAEAEAAASPS